MSEAEILTTTTVATSSGEVARTPHQPPPPPPHSQQHQQQQIPPEMTAAEARWRNYQRLLWTQQIQRQIQSMNAKQSPHGESDGTGEVGIPNHGPFLRPLPDVQERTHDDKVKDGPEGFENFDSQQGAFLGPILWDKRLPYDGSDFKLEYVDLEEFLTENGIPFDPSIEATFAVWKPVDQPDTTGPSSVTTSNSPTSPLFLASQFMPGQPRGPDQIHNVSHTRENHLASQEVPQSRSPSPCSSSSNSTSQDGTPAVSPDSTQLTELHPAAISGGHEFDPRIRAFTDDELKPQPMIKKSKKQFIPDEQKDTRYWARRRKNNLAAKRSRDARRVKENQIAMRACFLEKENHILKQEMERIQAENSILKEQLSHYH